MSTKTILVVDDEFTIRRLLARVLRKPGVQVITADTVDTAETQLVYNQVDLILCDHQMPGEKGISFLSRLRSQYPEMVRALMTGDVDFDVTMKAINEGRVDYCVAKPFEIVDLQKIVVDLLCGQYRREATPQVPHRDVKDASDVSDGSDADVIVFGDDFPQMVGA